MPKNANSRHVPAKPTKRSFAGVADSRSTLGDASTTKKTGRS